LPDQARARTWGKSRLTPEDLRLWEGEAILNRARRNPPLTEVLSGAPLNAVLMHLALDQAKGRGGPAVDLDAELLRRINVVPEGTCGSMGVLRDGAANFSWPLPLEGPRFATPRKDLEHLLLQAVQQARIDGRISYPIYKGMRDAKAQLDEALDRSANDLTPTQFIQSRRFLNHINEGIKALSNANAGNFFSQKWTARGKTVAELVQNMAKEGLKFAPAGPGDEAAYRALLNALTAYDAGITQGAARSIATTP